MKYFWYGVAGVIIGGVAVWLFFKHLYEPSETKVVHRKKNDLVIFNLPRSTNPQVFGPKYWSAFHALAAMVPCPDCRQDAIPLEVFKHDIVNRKLGKPLFDPANWKKQVEFINNLDKNISCQNSSAT